MKKEIEQLNQSDDIKTSESQTEGFDDLIIDITKNSIAFQRTYFSTLRIRGGVFTGVAGIIVNLLFLMGFDTILGTITDISQISNQNLNLVLLHIISLITGILSIAALLVSLAAGLSIIMPRKKLKLLDPRKLNNEFANKKIPETKQAIKLQLIQDFKILKDDNEDLEHTIRISFRLLIIGIGSLAVFAFFTSQTTLNFFANS